MRAAHGIAQVRTHRRPRSQCRLRHRGCPWRGEATTRHSRRLGRAGRFHPGARDRPNVPRLPTRPASSGDRASHVLRPNECPSFVSGLRCEHVALLLRELAQQEPDVPRWTQSLSRDDEATATGPHRRTDSRGGGGEPASWLILARSPWTLRAARETRPHSPTSLSRSDGEPAQAHLLTGVRWFGDRRLPAPDSPRFHGRCEEPARTGHKWVTLH